MKIDIIHYRDINKSQLYDALSLRAQVFVVEQTCPYQDVDYKDQEAWHVFIYENSQLNAYLRIIEPEKEVIWIGRVVVRENERGRELGKKAMLQALHFCSQEYPNIPIKISAQSHLQDYYSLLGFVPYGSGYLEDDIPHHGMIYSAS